MISLQRSMHSSQMYTPGPAMSFLTCFWLLPQNEHFSRSPPSPMRATQLLLYMGPPRRPDDRPSPAGRSREAVQRACISTVPRPGFDGHHQTLSAAREGRTACSRLGRHYLHGLLRAALDQSQDLVDDAVVLGLFGGEELVPLDVVADRLLLL